MGEETASTVYVAELRCIELALQIALDVQAMTSKPGRCTIFTDNQAAIREMANPQRSSGQYLLIEAVHALNTLRDLGWEIQIR
jgi:hypothetical protein